MTSQSTGKEGEDLAVAYLVKNNYEIVERNFRRKWGEIDIVARDKETKELVFVEVKTRKTKYSASPRPEEMLTKRKIHHLQRVFLSYLASLKRENIPWRFDFIAVEIDKQFSLPTIRHYKNLFLQF